MQHYERMWRTLDRNDRGSPTISERAAVGAPLIEKTFSETYLRLELTGRTHGRARRVLVPIDPGEARVG